MTKFLCTECPSNCVLYIDDPGEIPHHCVYNWNSDTEVEWEMFEDKKEEKETIEVVICYNCGVVLNTGSVIVYNHDTQELDHEPICPVCKSSLEYQPIYNMEITCD